MANSTTWVGIDDAANKFDVAIFFNQDENPHEEFRPNTRGISQFPKAFAHREE